MSAENGFQHKCPVRGCTLMVPDTMLMCAPHWRRVTRPTANKVYDEYRREPGSQGHQLICQQAIREVEAKL